MVKELATIDDFKLALGNENNGLVIIDFYANWCGPCRAFSNKYEKYAEKYPTVGFYKINIETKKISQVINACMVNSLPTFCFFKGGVYITQLVGASESNFEKMILENI